MPILNNPRDIRPLLETVSNQKISIPCFGAENTFTIEGILTGAMEIGQKYNLDRVPVFVAATARYSGRQQLKNYTSLKNTHEGFLAFRSDLERLARADGPFERVVVIPSLDHGDYRLDADLFDEYRDFWGCVMYDCSTLPLKDNQKETAKFVKTHRDFYLIEGCVDEITEAGDGKQLHLTQPRDAELYLRETSVDLMVVNLGTEHRATEGARKYHGDIAGEIRDIVGNRLVLHGASSLTGQDFVCLGNDGIIKVNIWTILETKTAQKQAEDCIRKIGRMLPLEKVQELYSEGWLGKKAVDQSQASHPELNCLTEVYRRDEIKVPRVSLTAQTFLTAFGYEHLKL